MKEGSEVKLRGLVRLIGEAADGSKHVRVMEGISGSLEIHLPYVSGPTHWKTQMDLSSTMGPKPLLVWRSFHPPRSHAAQFSIIFSPTEKGTS